MVIDDNFNYKFFKKKLLFYKILNYQSLIVSLVIIIYLRLLEYKDIKHLNEDYFKYYGIFKIVIKFKGFYFAICNFELINFLHFYLYNKYIHQNKLILVCIRIFLDSFSNLLRIYLVIIFIKINMLTDYKLSQSFKIILIIDTISRSLMFLNFFFIVDFYKCFERNKELKMWYKKKFLKYKE